MGLLSWLSGLFGRGSSDDAGDAADGDDGGSTAAGGEETAPPADETTASADDSADAGEQAAAEGADAGTAGDEQAAAADDAGAEPERSPPTEGAEMLVDQATAHGYDLDYSPESLATLDDLVADLPDQGLADAAAHFGAYLGEVFTRNYDGVWTLHDDVGWVVELEGDGDGEGTTTLAVSIVVRQVFEDEVTFAEAHDATLDGLTTDGTALADGEYPEDVPGPTLQAPATTAASEDLVAFYQDVAAELVESWPDKRLNYTPESLERLDDLVEEVYDLEDEGEDADAVAAAATSETDDVESAEDVDDEPEGAADGEADEAEADDGTEADADDDADADEADAEDADPDADEADVADADADVDDDAQADADDGDGDADSSPQAAAAETAEETDDDDGVRIVPEGVDIGVRDGYEAQAFAGYVGEVFVRNYEAEWRLAGNLPKLVVRGADATAEIDPLRLVAGAFQGGTSFTEVHERVLEDAGLEATGDPVKTDPQSE